MARTANAVTAVRLVAVGAGVRQFTPLRGPEGLFDIVVLE
jgi:hypothetical protein